MVRVQNPGVIILFVIVVFASGCGINPPIAPIGVSMSPQSALVGSGQVIQFTATVTGDTSGVGWSVNGVPGGNATVGMIDSLGNYSAPNLTQNGSATITATSVKDSTKSSSAKVSIIAPGIVSMTANVQVAQYAIAVPDGLTVLVEFGLDTSYGLTTWALPAPSGGGSVIFASRGHEGQHTLPHARRLSIKQQHDACLQRRRPHLYHRHLSCCQPPHAYSHYDRRSNSPIRRGAVRFAEHQRRYKIESSGHRSERQCSLGL